MVQNMAIMSSANLRLLVVGTLLVPKRHIIVIMVPVKDMLSESNVKQMEDGLGEFQNAVIVYYYPKLISCK